jgi:hypothetical protein
MLRAMRWWRAPLCQLQHSIAPAKVQRARQAQLSARLRPPERQVVRRAVRLPPKTVVMQAMAVIPRQQAGGLHPRAAVSEAWAVVFERRVVVFEP